MKGCIKNFEIDFKKFSKVVKDVRRYGVREMLEEVIRDQDYRHSVPVIQSILLAEVMYRHFRNVIKIG